MRTRRMIGGSGAQKRFRTVRRAALGATIAGALLLGSGGSGLTLRPESSTEGDVPVTATVSLDAIPLIQPNVWIRVDLSTVRLPDAGVLGCRLLGAVPGGILPTQICVRVVTHAIVGGQQRYREHNVLVSLGDVDRAVGSALDVTGDGVNDVRVTIAVPPILVPPGVDTDRPSLKVVRLAGAPTNLPLKIEAVVPTGLRQRSLGYDSRPSTVPQSFTARIDLSNRDGDTATDQVKAALNIAAGASKNVGLVTEEFTAGVDLRESARTIREVALLGYRADAGAQTLVPQSAGIDVTRAPSSTRAMLTRSDPTTLDFLLSQPDRGGVVPCVGCDPAVKTFSGTVSVLPRTTDLTITEKADDEVAIDYFASNVVPQLVVSFEHLAGTTDLHRQTIGARVDQFPTEAHFGYAPELGKLSLRTPGERVPLALITGEDEEPFFDGAKTFALLLNDIPSRVDAVYGSGRINADAYGDAIGRVEFRGQDAVREIVIPECKTLVPPGGTCDDSYAVLRDPDASGVLIDDLANQYLLYARVHNLKTADLKTTPDLDVVVDTAPDLGPPGSGCGFEPPPGCDVRSETYRRFLAGIHTPWDADPDGPPNQLLPVQDLGGSISQLFPQTSLSYVKVGEPTEDDADDVGTISYSNASNGGRPSVLLDGTNIQSLPKGDKGATIDELHLRMESVPGSLQFRYDGNGGLNYGADDGLGLLEVQLTSGSDEELPGILNGIMLRDFADRYVIHARVDGLNAFSYSKFRTPTGEFVDSGGTIPWYRIGHDIGLMSNGNRQFAADLQEANADKDQGFEYQQAFITESLPNEIQLNITKHAFISPAAIPALGIEQGENTRWTEVSYNGDESADTLQYFSNAGKDRELLHARIDPLPQGLDLCLAPDSNDCHPSLDEAEEGSYYLDMTEPVRVQLFDCKDALTDCGTTLVRSSMIVRDAFGGCQGVPYPASEWACARAVANSLTNSEKFVYADLDLQHLALAIQKNDSGFDYAIDTNGLGVVGTVYIHKDDGFDKWVWFPDDDEEDFWAEDRIGNVDCGLQWGDLCDGDSNGSDTAHCPPGVDIWIDTETFALGVADFAEEVCPG